MSQEDQNIDKTFLEILETYTFADIRLFDIITIFTLGYIFEPFIVGHLKLFINKTQYYFLLFPILILFHLLTDNEKILKNLLFTSNWNVHQFLVLLLIFFAFTDTKLHKKLNIL